MPLQRSQSLTPGQPAVRGTKHRLHPKKLLLSKWTAVTPLDRDKHFLVVSVVLPEPPETAVQWVEIEAVRSLKRQRLGWRALQDPLQWRQGWV